MFAGINFNPLDARSFMSYEGQVPVYDIYECMRATGTYINIFDLFIQAMIASQDVTRHRLKVPGTVDVTYSNGLTQP
jgi:hypothetical protein